MEFEQLEQRDPVKPRPHFIPPSTIHILLMAHNYRLQSVFQRDLCLLYYCGHFVRSRLWIQRKQQKDLSGADLAESVIYIGDVIGQNAD